MSTWSQVFSESIRPSIIHPTKFLPNFWLHWGQSCNHRMFFFWLGKDHGNLPCPNQPSWRAGTSPLLTPFPFLSGLFPNPAPSGFPQVFQPFPEGDDAQSSSCLVLFLGKGENPSLELEFALVWEREFPRSRLHPGSDSLSQHCPF